jgi:hypothetical protein
MSAKGKFIFSTESVKKTKKRLIFLKNHLRVCPFLVSLNNVTNLMAKFTKLLYGLVV